MSEVTKEIRSTYKVSNELNFLLRTSQESLLDAWAHLKQIHE
jgi:hypothetical protein